ncbi:polymorphic toxin-type HINT domain-containing protein [Paenibacillus dendritiformis]|uniref:polymorphic toxin-type HINT domain-containing protein n=1 Tax=Paenibacillus dendritiformis TaxID=130049 RepID=UPI003668BA85
MKKIISLMLFFILSVTSIPLASAQSIANCNLHCFSAGTPVLTNTGFKPIEEIRIGDFVLTKDELTGKTGYNTVVQLFQRQATETYQITVKGITITTTEEHPFWIPGRGWTEARHLKVGDLLQNPEGKLYPIDRIEINNNCTTVYNFRVEGVHNYFVTELEIWTHNCGAGGIRNVPISAPTGGGQYRVNRELPRYENGIPKPDTHNPHTQIGEKQGRNGSYRQTREFGKNGDYIKDTDWTNHGRKNHTSPHDHYYIPNSTGGTKQRGGPTPLQW